MGRAMPRAELYSHLAGARKTSEWSSPLLLNLSIPEDQLRLTQLFNDRKVSGVFDQIDAAVSELFDIEFPERKDDKTKQEIAAFKGRITNGDDFSYGTWVFYPWSGNLVHFPPKDHLRSVRSSRNRNLITGDEQKRLTQDKTILIVGLSVGSSVADALLLQSIGSRYVLVDMDKIDPSNLNRIRAPYSDIGIHKVDAVAKRISELDPYVEQIHYKDGLNEENLQEILQKYRPHVIVDEMDELRMKIILRLRAREFRIPVLMATDNGDNIILDIERFDTSADVPILHGILPQPVIDELLKNQGMTRRELGALIGQHFVDLRNVPLKMIGSLVEVGRTLPSWPQLGGAAVLSGLYVAYAAKKIILEQPLKSGRFLMGPDAQLDPEVGTPQYEAERSRLIEQMKRS